MSSAVMKRLRALRRSCVHGLVLVGLVPKFLVPVGYMPAALADGGPLMLCDAFAPVASAAPVPAVLPAQSPHAHHDAGRRAAALHAEADVHADTGAHAHRGMPVPGNGELQTAGGADHGDDHGDDDHHEWKRCSLGGLAALAAVTSDWQIGLAPATHERVAVATTPADTRARRIVFRSRAPPHA